MKITRIETVISSAFRVFTWVQVYTDDGLIGTGETTSGHDAVTGYVHEEAAQFLLGQDPIAIERHFATLSRVNHLGGDGTPGNRRRDARSLGHRHSPLGHIWTECRAANLPIIGRVGPRPNTALQHLLRLHGDRLRLEPRHKWTLRGRLRRLGTRGGPARSPRLCSTWESRP